MEVAILLKEALTQHTSLCSWKTPPQEEDENALFILHQKEGEQHKTLQLHHEVSILEADRERTEEVHLGWADVSAQPSSTSSPSLSPSPSPLPTSTPSPSPSPSPSLSPSPSPSYPLTLGYLSRISG